MSCVWECYIAGPCQRGGRDGERERDPGRNIVQETQQNGNIYVFHLSEKPCLADFLPRILVSLQ